ncbi:hypothetical protein TWF718_007421 [Orbilia javanica]|uniref:Extracellular membrane protein CFEM domain-containing protein n=1 Tax=Orbilia javanica TaxID=47235 RepID=A0AAN8RDV5_9PEZI
MSRTILPYTYLTLLLLLLTTPPTASQITDAPQTIDHSPPYLSLRSCAQLCFWQPYPRNFRSDVIASYLSCTQPNIYYGALESCWCRHDYQPDVVNYISSCVSSKCKDSPGDYRVDISKATGAYREYCGSVVSREGGGTGVAPASTGVQETGSPSVLTDSQNTIEDARTSQTESIPVNTNPPSTLISITATAASINPNPTTTAPPEASAETQSKGLSKGAIAGIAGGIVGAILLLVLLGVGVFFKQIRRRFVQTPVPTREVQQEHMSTSANKEEAPPLSHKPDPTFTAPPVKNEVVHGSGRIETEYVSPARQEV